jgi:hypothetical protein
MAENEGHHLALGCFGSVRILKKHQITVNCRSRKKSLRKRESMLLLDFLDARIHA